MNCPNCNRSLEPNARFCPNCGASISQDGAKSNPAPLYQPVSSREAPPVLPASPDQTQYPQQSPQQYAPPQSQPSSPQPQSPYFQRNPPSAPSQSGSQPQAPYFQRNPPAAPQQPGSQPQPQAAPYFQRNPPSAANTLSSKQEAPRRRRRMGCFTRGLIVLIVLVLIIGGAWFFAVQPYLSSIAQSRLDNVLTQAVNNIPEQISLLPDGPVKIPQEALNNLLVLESSPSDIIQNPQVSITPDLARFTFQVYGFNCAATGQLAVSKGKLIATNVNIEGIAALILTPDQVAAAVNRHFADAEVKIKHSITAARLANQELDLTLGPPLAGSGQPSGTPTTIPTSIPTSIPSAVPSAISTLIP